MHENFLQAILASPADDTPRLVYADWLDEQGDGDRADFIRVQCALARMAEDDPARAALRARERRLLYAHARKWRQHLPPCARESPDRGYSGWPVPAEGFSRGFVAHVRTSGRVFARDADHLCQRTPLESADLICEGPGCVSALAELPQLARLTRMNLIWDWEFADNSGPGLLTPLLRSPHLANLTRLGMRVPFLGDEALAALAASPHLGGLRELSLGGNFITASGFLALASSRLTGLSRLSLPFNQIGPIPRAGLRDAPGFSRLVFLDLTGNLIEDEGAQALASSPALSRLAELELRDNVVQDAGARALASSPHLSGLRRLSLRQNQIGPAGVLALRNRFGRRVVLS